MVTARQVAILEVTARVRTTSGVPDEYLLAFCDYSQPIMDDFFQNFRDVKACLEQCRHLAGQAMSFTGQAIKMTAKTSIKAGQTAVSGLWIITPFGAMQTIKQNLHQKDVIQRQQDLIDQQRELTQLQRDENQQLRTQLDLAKNQA